MIVNNSVISFNINPNLKGGVVGVELYFGEKLISNEDVYLPSYLTSLKYTFQLISTDKLLVNNELKWSATDHDLFVQLMETNHPKNNYTRYRFHLDESIDQYSIFILQKDSHVRIIWNCWDKANINKDHDLNVTYGITMTKEGFLDIIEKVIAEFDAL